MSSEHTSINCGLGSLATTLTVVFVVLKLVGVIDWSWWWVFSPLIISTILGLILLAIIGVIYVAIKKLVD